MSHVKMTFIVLLSCYVVLRNVVNSAEWALPCPYRLLHGLSSFPALATLYKLLLTVSVTSVSAERAMSKVKLVKTRLRSTMTDEYFSIHGNCLWKRSGKQIFLWRYYKSFSVYFSSIAKALSLCMNWSKVKITKWRLVVEFSLWV